MLHPSALYIPTYLCTYTCTYCMLYIHIRSASKVMVIVCEWEAIYFVFQSWPSWIAGSSLKQLFRFQLWFASFVNRLTDHGCLMCAGFSWQLQAENEIPYYDVIMLELYSNMILLLTVCFSPTPVLLPPYNYTHCCLCVSLYITCMWYIMHTSSLCS